MKHNLKLTWLAFSLLLNLSFLHAQKRQIGGTVIQEEMNLAGRITDSGTGEGIPGVPVTDGFNFTVTDENGVYQMKAHPRSMYVSFTQPSEYMIPQSRQHAPAFFSSTPIEHSRLNINDFRLEPVRSQNNKRFRFIMIGDPQVGNDNHLGRYSNEAIPDLRRYVSSIAGDGEEIFAMNLGDIVWNESSYFKPVIDQMNNIRIGKNNWLLMYKTIGNHDHMVGYGDDIAAAREYMEVFGPKDYSFNRGDVHFISLDNCYCPEGGDKCQEIITDENLEWIRQDLALVQNKAEKCVVLCVHCPFAGHVAKSELHRQIVEMLAEFNEAHIFSAHWHSTLNYIHKDFKTHGGTPVYEHICATACGNWWQSTCCVDGIPCGYYVCTANGNKLDSWYFKGTMLDPSYQLRVYDGGQNYAHVKDPYYPTEEYRFATQAPHLEGCFVAVVFDEDDMYWKVEMEKDGVRYPMTRIENPIYDACFCAYNRFVRRNPSERYPKCKRSHFYYMKAPSGVPSKEKGWQVIATKTFPGSGKTVSYTRSYLTVDFAEFIY